MKLTYTVEVLDRLIKPLPFSSTKSNHYNLFVVFALQQSCPYPGNFDDFQCIIANDDGCIDAATGECATGNMQKNVMVRATCHTREFRQSAIYA